MVPVSDSDLVLAVVSESVGVSEVCHWVSWVSEQVEDVELGLALDGDLALPLAVIIELQKLHLKALISIVRLKAIVNHQLTTQRLPPLRRLFVLKSKYVSLPFCQKQCKNILSYLFKYNGTTDTLELYPCYFLYCSPLLGVSSFQRPLVLNKSMLN